MDILQGTIVVKTLQGLESLLADEMSRLGAPAPEIRTRAVVCEGTGNPELLYRLNFHLRTGLRVYVKLSEGRVSDYDDLYAHVKEMAWETLFRSSQTLAVHATCYSDVFTHSHFTALKVKDAIVDKLRESTGRRPNVDTQNPNYSVHILIRGLDMELYLDTSGEPLFKRGYREPGARAPLNESLAAGLVMLSNWQPDKDLLWDPMCGSGTIAIEAAMIQAGIAPGLLRENYGFQRWGTWDAELFSGIKSEAESMVQRVARPAIYASDKDGRQVRLAKSNAMAAGVLKHIRWSSGDFFHAKTPADRGVMITNPPYDERMALDDAVAFYKGIGDKMKADMQSWDAWIFSGQLDGMKHLGLRPGKKHKLYNGPIPCLYNHYELFSGKRNAHLAESSET